MIGKQLWRQENRNPLPLQADDVAGTCTLSLPILPSHDYFSFPGKELESPSSVNRTASTLVIVGLPLHLVYEPNTTQERRKLSPYLPAPQRVYSTVGWRCCSSEEPSLCVWDGLNI